MIHLPRLDADDYGNGRLHALLRRVHPDDVRSFVEKLTKQPLCLRLDTYHELLVGVHFRDRGFDMRYEREIGGQTPDWSLGKEDTGAIEVLDVFTVHQRHDKDVEISNAIRSSGRWSGWITIPPDHIYRKLNDKAGQYSRLAKLAGSPYVLAVYGAFTASVTPEEVRHILLVQHGGWFTNSREVSGVIYCREKNFQFDCTYFPNPHAAHQSVLVPMLPTSNREA